LASSNLQLIQRSYICIPTQDRSPYILNELADDQLGLEAYYNFAVTPWLQISADVQWVDQGISTSDDAWVVGSRQRIRF
jgi:porin